MSSVHGRGPSADTTLVVAAGVVAAVGLVMQAGGGHAVADRTTLVHAGWLIAVGVGMAGVRRAFLAEARVAARTAEQRRATEDRLRLAGDLHDALGHHLSLINVQANAALHRPDADRSAKALTAIKQVSGETLHELRGTLAALRQEGTPPAAPGLSDLDGLIEATARSGLVVRAEVTGTGPPVRPEVDAAAYRIVQEALTNVTRHAGATVVVVRVRPDDGGLRIEVDDDGTGSPGASPHGPPGPWGPGAPDGSGIAGMRARARALGGSLTAGPRPRGGCRVTAHLPRRAGPLPP
jgi:signal transduction histidine kinase